jgi:hypothetical protein
MLELEIIFFVFYNGTRYNAKSKKKCIPILLKICCLQTLAVDSQSVTEQDQVAESALQPHSLAAGKGWGC